MRRIAERLGYRGLALLIVGLIYGGIGWGVLAMPQYVPDLLHTHLPLAWRLCIWWISGGLAVLAALLTFARAHAGAVDRIQRIAFGLMIIGPLQRFGSFAWATITGHTLDRFGGAMVWLLVLLLVALIAAWPEPPPRASTTAAPTIPTSTPPPRGPSWPQHSSPRQSPPVATRSERNLR